MFAHPPFAEFSQVIGLASLGASEQELSRLAAVYWYTVEFGMCKEDGDIKAYGAGILGSVDELKHCVSGKPQMLPLDMEEIV